jgi:hypothetical protein
MHEPGDDLAFDAAWEHHWRHNPHHWQYWSASSDGTQHRVFLANVIGTNKTIALPPQGMAVSDLMGELSHEAWRDLTYTQMLTSTDSWGY